MDTCILVPRGLRDIRVRDTVGRRIGLSHSFKPGPAGIRYKAIVISQEEEAQVDRLTYVLSNGVKEGIVARVLDGVCQPHCTYYSDGGRPGIRWKGV